MELLVSCAGTAAQFGLGWLGFLAAKKMRVPSPAIIGALIVLGALNLAGVQIPFVKGPVAFTAKVLSGVIIGQKIDRGTLGEMRKMLLPVTLSSAWMVGISVLAGFLLYGAGGGRLSMMTCLAASAAGGISEMSIFAMSSGADVGIVAFFQSVRIFVVCLTLPFLTRWMASHGGPVSAENTQADCRAAASPCEMIFFAIVVCGGAFLFSAIGSPSPYMIGAMCAAAAMNLTTGKKYPLPRWLRTVAQTCLSITVAVTLSPETVRLAVDLFAPLLVSVALIQTLALVLAWILKRITRWDATTLVLATCPGGLSQVLFLSEDYGADSLVVGILHTVRMISIVVCVPIVARTLG